MRVFRVIAAFFIFLLLTAALLAGLAGGLLTEISMIRLHVPAVTGLGIYSESSRLEIYAADSTLMYRKDFKYGGRLTETDNLTLAGYMIELARSERRERPFWEKAFLRLEKIDPEALESFAAEYYTESLTKLSSLTGAKGAILRWYTLQRLCGKYSGRELYALFLDSVYFSDNIHGIKGAGEAYFGKEFNELSPLETAWLIATVTDSNKETEDNDTLYHDKVARNYLHELYKVGMLTHEEYREGITSPLNFSARSYPVVDPAYVDFTLKRIQRYPQLKPAEQNLKIYTHYNPKAMTAARKAFAPTFAKDSKMQGAFVMINVETGGLEAALGSRIPNGVYNRAFSLRRQMGSTFKPLVYLTAFKQRRLPSEMIWDKPYIFTGSGADYMPRNYHDVFMGYIPMRYGLVYSLNNATVHLAQKVGLNRVYQTAIDLGFSSNISPYYAMALGSFATTPLNVAEIFATIGAYGIRQDITPIKEALGEGGGIPLKVTPPVRTVDAISAYQTLYIMQDVSVRGTARSANLLRGTAAKTGTSDHSKDLWTVAICYPYVIVVWLGYDDFSYMREELSGGNTAAPILAAFQREYFGAGKSFTFSVPSGVEFAVVNRSNGLLTNKEGYGAYMEAFRAGYLPKFESDAKPKPLKPTGERKK